jgi:RNA polymerase sigma-70 factor (ECF subfamily)
VLASVDNRQLAEELVADAFAKAWTSWTRVGRHPAPQAWVVRTALNTNVSWWRKRHREVELTNHDGALREVSDGIDDTLMAAVRRLPARQREVVVLRVFLDLDTATTAKALGVSEGTVMSHLSRAAAALRRTYTGAHPAEPLDATVSLAQPREGLSK